MHVLVAPSFYPTASAPTAGIFFRDQARALAVHGNTVGVLCCTELAPWQDREFWSVRLAPTRVDDGGVWTVQEPVRRWWPGRHRLRLRTWVSAALTLFERYVSERGAPDLVHVHIADPAGMFALRVKERFGIPYVLTEHATWLARGGKGKISDGVARAVIAGASACIAVSPDLARRLTDRFPGPSGGWRCIPNMVDPIFLDVRLGGNRPRSRDSFVFLYVANLIPRKGHDLLLRSFARAFGSEKTTRLRLVGGGPLRRSLQRLAARLGIADRVHLVGPLSRTGVMEEVAACNAIAVPSEFETFGVILIEAMAAGKPAVSTRCGGPEWIVTDDTGLLIDARDDHAFSDALLRMRHEAATYDPQAIRREAQRRFAPKVVSVALSQVYREVAG